MNEREEIERHESYGMIGFSRVSSNPPANFFGSSIRSGHYIHLRIKRGSRRRDISNDWYYGDETLIELRLSPNQFAELLTSLNVGDGVPCTLEQVGRSQMADCPSRHQREIFEREFGQSAREAVVDAESALNEVRQLLDKPSIGKADRKTILNAMQSIINSVRSRMPWVQSQFNEAMDKTVAEAKGEVEAFVNHKIHSLGINALNSEIMAALEAPLDSEPLQLRAESERSSE